MNMLLALFCIFLFSLTVPLTRLATFEMPPMLVVSFRLFGAAAICAVLMAWERWRPPLRILPQLGLTALGGVLGFSLLTAFALQQVPGSHGAIGLAALPVVTAAYSSLRDRRNPGPLFWAFALLGTLLSVAWFLSDSAGTLAPGDFLLVLAVLSATLGYVEGGRLSREFGGRRVTSWAILLSMPLALLFFMPQMDGLDLEAFSARSWLSVAYLALVSQSLGMFLWYRVLARGPMEKVALVQLLQPFCTLLAALLLLGEKVDLTAWLSAAAVVFCIYGASRSSVRRPS